MPPYRFDSSRAWGRHYGQDFGGGSADPLMLALGLGAIANNMAFSLDNGLTWAACSGLPASGNWRGAAYSPSLGYAIAVSFTGVVVQSFDGITWATVADNLPNASIQDVIRAENLGLFIASSLVGGGAGLRMYSSPDGITWTNRATPATPNQYDALFQNPLTGRIFAGAVSDSGPGNAQSDDGITWVAGAATPANFQANQWGFFDDGANGYLVAAGGTTFAPVPRLALLSTTDNGASWVIRPQSANANQGIGILLHPVSGLMILTPAAGGIASQHGVFSIARTSVAPVPTDWVQSTNQNNTGWMHYNVASDTVFIFIGNGPRFLTSPTGTGAWTDTTHVTGLTTAGKLYEFPFA